MGGRPSGDGRVSTDPLVVRQNATPTPRLKELESF